MPKPSYPALLGPNSIASGIVACWPLNEGSGAIATDIVGAGALDCSGSGVSWSASPLGLLTVGASSRASLATPEYLQIQTPISILWLGEVLGAQDQQSGAGVSQSTGMFGAWYDDYTVSNGYVGATKAWSIYTNEHGTGGIGYIGSMPATTGSYNVIGRFGPNQPGQLSSVTETIAVNGSVDETVGSGAIDAIVYGTGTAVFLGAEEGSTGAANLRHDLFVVWQRLLTDAEIASLYSDPWQIFSGSSGAAILPGM